MKIRGKRRQELEAMNMSPVYTPPSPPPPPRLALTFYTEQTNSGARSGLADAGQGVTQVRNQEPKQ